MQRTGHGSPWKKVGIVGVVLLILVVTSGLSYRISVSNGDTTRAMQHAGDVLALASAARADLETMQASDYEFLLTARDDVLIPFAEGRSAYERHLQALMRLSAGDADQLARWRDLDTRAEQWQQSWVVPGSALRRHGPPGSDVDAALAAWIGLGDGKAQIDAMRAVLAEATAAEQARSAALRNDADAANGALQLLRLLGTPLVLGLFLMTLRLFREHGARMTAESQQRRTERLRALTAALLAADAPFAVAAVAVDHGVRALGAVAGLVVFPSGDRLQIAHASGYSPELLSAFSASRLDAPTPLAEAVRTGRAIWVESAGPASAAIPFVAADGRLLGALALSLSGRRAFEPDDRELLEAMVAECTRALERAHLFESERAAHATADAAVRARDEFLSVASHELRTPVTLIKLAAQLLGDSAADVDLPNTAWLQKSVHQLEAGADRLVRLTNDLLDVTRLQTGRLQIRPGQMDLAELIRRVATSYYLRLARDQYLVLDGEASSGTCALTADSLRVEQVLTNLLDNALKFSPHGGTVRLGIEAEHSGWLVTVRDQGLGLPAGSEESIFQPFGRTVNAASIQIAGMGLGLYVCRQIVEGHGGRVWAESGGEGEGSQFKLWLPFVPGHAVTDLAYALTPNN